MNRKIVIRSETDADVSAITGLTVAAFKTLELSNHTEQFIIAALRNARALTLSLVAELDGRMIGHIAFSPPDHFGRHAKLVRLGTPFGAAGVSAAGHRQGPDTGRACTVESNACSGMLSCGTSGLLQEIRVHKYTGTCA